MPVHVLHFVCCIRLFPCHRSSPPSPTVSWLSTDDETPSVRCTLEVGPKKRSRPTASLFKCHFPPQSLEIMLLVGLGESDEAEGEANGLSLALSSTRLGTISGCKSKSRGPTASRYFFNSVSSDSTRPLRSLISFREYCSLLISA